MSRKKKVAEPPRKRAVQTPARPKKPVPYDEPDQDGRGARRKLTQMSQDIICTGIKLGLTLKEIGAEIGVPSKTICLWLKKGREQKSGPYREFYGAVKLAKNASVAYYTTRIAAHGKKHPTALMWLAERTPHLRERFRPPRVDVMVRREVGGVMERLEKGLPKEVFEQVLEVIAEGDELDEEDETGGGAE